MFQHQFVKAGFTEMKRANLLLVHVLHTDLDGASVGFELFYLGELHDCLAYVAKALGCEVRAGNVLDIRAEVDTRVLLGVAICSCGEND